MASLADRPLTTPDRYDYQLTFVKKDGKWEVEKAYNSDSFMEKFEEIFLNAKVGTLGHESRVFLSIV